MKLEPKIINLRQKLVGKVCILQCKYINHSLTLVARFCIMNLAINGGSKDIILYFSLWAIYWWMDVYIRNSILNIIGRPVVYLWIQLGRLSSGMQVRAQHTPRVATQEDEYVPEAV